MFCYYHIIQTQYKHLFYIYICYLYSVILNSSLQTHALFNYTQFSSLHTFHVIFSILLFIVINLFLSFIRSATLISIDKRTFLQVLRIVAEITGLVVFILTVLK